MKLDLGRGVKLAVVLSHPIQYYAPWFAYLSNISGLELRVFYLMDTVSSDHHDRDFGMAFSWDIPLLEGYNYEFVRNLSRRPGTHHFFGLINPSLVNRLLTWRPDTILLFGYNYATHVRLLTSSALKNIPIIFRGDSHNLGRPVGFKARLFKVFRRMLLRRIDAFLSVGKANTDYLQDCAAGHACIFFAPHFVDNRRFTGAASDAKLAASVWRKSIGLNETALVIGFVGKYEPNKRAHDLILAGAGLAASLGRSASSIQFLFVGSGALEQSLKQIAADRIGQDIFFAPFQNQTEMPKVYAAMDFLVLPSGSETWGLCVNEAMNLGVPAIVSDLVGCGPDLVIEGETGWTFRSGDVEDLRRVLSIAINVDPERAEEMSEATKQLVAGYSLERAADGLCMALEWVLSGKAGSGRAGFEQFFQPESSNSVGLD